MKNYAKNQYAGNINKWDESEYETKSIHAMSEAQAEELNKQFEATGIKYVETGIKPHEFKDGAPADHTAKEETDESRVKTKTPAKPKAKAAAKAEEKQLAEKQQKA